MNGACVCRGGGGNSWYFQYIAIQIHIEYKSNWTSRSTTVISHWIFTHLYQTRFLYLYMNLNSLGMHIYEVHLPVHNLSQTCWMCEAQCLLNTQTCIKMNQDAHITEIFYLPSAAQDMKIRFTATRYHLRSMHWCTASHLKKQKHCLLYVLLHWHTS